MSLSFTGAGAFATSPRGDYDRASLAYAESMLQRTGSYQSVSQATRIPVHVLRDLCRPPQPRAPFRLVDPPKPVIAKHVKPKAVRAKRVRKPEPALARASAAKPKPAAVPAPVAAAPAPSMEDIKRAVAAHYGLSVDDIDCGSKRAPLALPRQVSMWMCRNMTGQSFPAIGRHHGGRDHTTAVYAVKKMGERIAEDRALAEVVAMLGVKLMGGLTSKAVAA